MYEYELVGRARMTIAGQWNGGPRSTAGSSESRLPTLLLGCCFLAARLACQFS